MNDENEPKPPPEYDTLKEARRRAKEKNRNRPSALITHGQQAERW